MKNLLFLLLLSCAFVTCKKEAKNCPDHYTGSNCDEQITPTNILLKRVFVTTHPPTDNGAGWDLTSGPDMYISILRNGTEIYNNSSNFLQNASGSNIVFDVNLPLPSVTDFYSIRLYDYDDFDADDYMGGVQGVLYSSTNGFQTLVPFDCAGCQVGFDVQIAYTF